MEFENTPPKATSNYKGWHLQQRPQVSSEVNEPEIETSGKEKTVSVRILDFIISLSLGALFFGLPLFFLNSTFQGIIFEKQMYFYFWVLVAIISWMTKSITVGELRIRQTPLDYLIGLFVILYFLSSIFSVDRWHSFLGFFGDQSRGFTNIIACIAVYYFILSNFTKKRLTIIFASIIASAMLVESWTLVGLFFATKLPVWLVAHIPANLFGSMISLGTFLSIIFPLFVLAIYKLQEAELAKKMKFFLTLMLGFFFILDIVLMWLLYPFVFISGVFPGLIVGVSFFVIFVIALIVRPKNGWAWLSIFSFVVALLILMIGRGDGHLPQALPIEISPSFSLSWDVAKSTLKEKFFIGTGSGTYGYDFSKYHSQQINETQYFNSRFYQGSGLLFEAPPTIGFLGTTSAVLLLLTYLGASIYLLSRDKQKNKLYSLGLFSSGIIFLYSALLSRIDGSLMIYGFLIVFVSLATLQFESNNEERYKKLSLKASPKYALALAFIFMLVAGGVAYVFVFMGKSLVADMYMKKATEKTIHTEDGSVSQMIKAINLYPNEARYYSRVGQEYILLANEEALKGKEKQDVSIVQQYLERAMLYSNRAKELAPNDVLMVEGLAQVYENSSMFVEKSTQLAEQYYNRALELEPHNPVFYLKLGEMKIATAAITQDSAEKKRLIEDSVGLFQKSVDEKKNYSVGYSDISIAKQALGDLDGAIEAAKSAFINEKNNMNYLFALANLFRDRGENDDLVQAEQIYKSIIEKDEKQYNVHLALGLFYEKQKKNESAIAEYKKVITLLPEGSDEAKTQINKMITNVQNGTGNLQKASQQATSQVPVQAPAQPSNIQSGSEEAQPQIQPQQQPLTPSSENPIQ